MWSLPLSNLYPGDILQILVENQGRIGYGSANVDFKGTIFYIQVNILKYLYSIHFYENKMSISNVV